MRRKTIRLIKDWAQTPASHIIVSSHILHEIEVDDVEHPADQQRPHPVAEGNVHTDPRA